jgi:hypothetical protein
VKLRDSTLEAGTAFHKRPSKKCWTHFFQVQTAGELQTICLLVSSELNVHFAGERRFRINLIENEHINLNLAIGQNEPIDA